MKKTQRHWLIATALVVVVVAVALVGSGSLFRGALRPAAGQNANERACRQVQEAYDSEVLTEKFAANAGAIYEKCRRKFPQVMQPTGVPISQHLCRRAIGLSNQGVITGGIASSQLVRCMREYPFMFKDLNATAQCAAVEQFDSRGLMTANFQKLMGVLNNCRAVRAQLQLDCERLENKIRDVGYDPGFAPAVARCAREVRKAATRGSIAQGLTSELEVLNENARSPYADIAGMWFEDAASTAYTLGWMSGNVINGQRIFAGGAGVIRSEFAVLAAGVLGMSNCDANALNAINDRAMIPDWAKDAVACMLETNNMITLDGGFKPVDLMTSYDLTVALYQIGQYVTRNDMDVVGIAAARFGIDRETLVNALNQGLNIVDGQAVVPQN